MIPNETPQSIETNGDGVKVVSNFRITDATQARILVSLSDKMYTRKELAFVREYSTNAADAHIVINKPIKDIIVSLPTFEDLNFNIRDFGSGLTEKQIAEVYCVFGESTKRNSNAMNGLLGYGCKAGFAHSDSFTVTSWVDGEKSIYQCIKGDSTKLHSTILLSRCASDEPSGIEICIPVKQNSMWTVHEEAANFYKHWPEIPTINAMADNHKEMMTSFRNNPPTLKGEGWEIRPKVEGHTATGVAYMGWVAYAINWNVLSNKMSLTAQKRVVFDLLQNNDVTLFFKMGEVQFVDSRESLEYTDLTLSALILRIESIIDKIKDAIQEKFTPLSNIWEAKKMYNSVFGTGILDLEKGESLNSDHIERIKILDGNLIKMESVFRGMFTWKEIVLDSSSFSNINRFDNDYPSSIGTNGSNPSRPVMISYKKKNKRAKISSCTAEKNNKILASNHVAVILNDTGLKSGQSLIARYLIFNNNSIIKTVHILTFDDNEIKNAFYEEYNFHTVPVLKFSEILPEAKKWNAANKTSRTYGSSSSGTRPMRYIDIETGEIRNNDVSIRDIEDGGFFIEPVDGKRGSTRVKLKNYYGTWITYNEFILHISTFIKKLELNVDRIYIITPLVKKAKWFKAAIQSEDWINIFDHLEENLSELDGNELRTANVYKTDTFMCVKSAQKLKYNIKNKDSFIFQSIDIALKNNYDKNLNLIAALEAFSLWNKVVEKFESNTNISVAMNQFYEKYPLLRHYSDPLKYEHYMNDEILKEIVEYVNMVDLHNKLKEQDTFVIMDEPKEELQIA